MRHEDKRTGAISVAGVGVPVLLWVLGELEVHPPKIVLYALLVLSAVMIVGPWLVIGRHHWRERGRRLVRGTELVPAASTIQRGKDLWREIGAEQITFRVQPWNTMLGMLLRNRTAEVERWATAAGSTKAVPTAPDGKPTEMDYAHLIAYVKEVTDAMDAPADSLRFSLELPRKELDALHGIVQSDAGMVNVPQARGKLTEISAGVKRVLAYSPLLRVYEADPPLPEKPLQGQLMDHDEALFEAELQHRRNMLAEVMDRLGEGAS